MGQLPPAITSLIEHFKKLPGIGHKSAERFVFKILDWNQKDLSSFGLLLQNFKDKIHFCSECGAISEKEKCLYCLDSQRDPKQICIVAYAKDIFAIEETHSFSGHYFVLGKLLSPMHNIDEQSLNLEKLIAKFQNQQIEEIIIAIDSTIEGDATTLYLKRVFKNFSVKMSRLAFGIPVGSSLDYIDGNTLSLALSNRHGF